MRCPRAGRQVEAFPAAGNEQVIAQLDGNSSLTNESEANYPKDDLEKNIQVQIGHRPRNESNPQGSAAERQSTEMKA